MKNDTQPAPKPIPPSALLIFSHGFDRQPLIVPNGGSEEIDLLIMAWFRAHLLFGRNGRVAA